MDSKLEGEDSKERFDEVMRFFNYLFPGDDVFEMCAIRPARVESRLWDGRVYGAKGIVSGWFDDKAKAAELAVELDRAEPEGIYVTLNPCNRALLGRASNRLIAGSTRTKDQEIPVIKHILIDIDPIRPSGTSSSVHEHLVAWHFALAIANHLKERGWPEPLLGDSGNGGHVILAIQDLENTADNVDLVKKILEAVQKRFARDALTEAGKTRPCFRCRDVSLAIDQSVYNPARLVKLYGTRTRKGDNTEDRPHRLSKILSLPNESHAVPLELLQDLIAEVFDRPLTMCDRRIKDRKPSLDVKTYLEDHGREVVRTCPHGDSTLYVLEECVFDSSHKSGEAAIGQTADGKLFYQCFHDSCKGRTWAEARIIISGDDKLAKYSPISDFKKDETPGRIGSSCSLPKIVTAAELSSMEFHELNCVIEGILPRGVTVLGGKPKTGKSWMVLDYAVAIAGSEDALGAIRTSKGKVLYLALEDNPRRLKQRLSFCCSGKTPPKEIFFATEWPRFDHGGLSKLDEWLDDNTDTVLVIIDTLAKLWPKGKSKSEGKTLYHHDYEFVSEIKKLADRRNIAILAVHHLRKSGSDDPIEQLSGSMGISGSADTLHILQRARGLYAATLYITGRDVEEQRLALEFDKACMKWRLLGKADEVARTKERQDILDILKDAPPEGLGPAAIAKSLKKTDPSVRKLLAKLLLDGQVRQKEYGKYILNSGHTDHCGSSAHTVHSSHTDHSFPDLLPGRKSVINE